MSMPVDAQGLKTRLLWGKPIAVEIERRALQRRRELDSAGVVACLAMVYAGEYTDAARYRRAIRLRAERAGILIREIQLPDQAPASTVVEVIHRLNGDGAVHAVLLQNPLPAESRQAGLAALRPEKDVEGLTATNLGRLIQGAPSVHPC